MNTAFWIPVILLSIIFIGFCWYDIKRADSVRFLPKWGWMIICAVSVPLGGLVYLTLGRAR